MVRPRRSALYLPAHIGRAVDKARSLACDAVILDLEDMVGLDSKEQARSKAAEAAQQGGFGTRELVIRVNGLDTPWASNDLATAAAARPDAILIPKITSVRDIKVARRAVGAEVPLWAMIETCGAIMALAEIGAASAEHGVTAWVVGSSDLAKDIGCTHDTERTGLLTGLSMSIMAARMHGIAVLDGVFTDLADPDGLTRQSAQAASLGFDGKTAIHPLQLDTINHAFTPSETAVAAARRIVEAFQLPENQGTALATVDGRLVERPHFESAVKLVRISEAIEATASQEPALLRLELGTP